MATKKKTEAENPVENVAGYQVELEEGEPKVTLTISELRELIAQEVQAQKVERAVAGTMKKDRKVRHVAAKPAKKVKVKLFKDNGMYKDPVFVAVNGHRFIVPRGVEVEVPEYIAQVLEESFRRDQATAEQLMTLEKKFKEDSRMLD